MTITPQPQGLSNGSVAPPKPLLVAFGGAATGAAGAAAEVHPPKSSSAVTVGAWTWTGLLPVDDIGSAQPPEISLGVMCSGGLPKSTLGAVGFAGAGSGAAQGLLSLPDAHGSNIAALV